MKEGERQLKDIGEGLLAGMVMGVLFVWPVYVLLPHLGLPFVSESDWARTAITWGIILLCGFWYAILGARGKVKESKERSKQEVQPVILSGKRIALNLWLAVSIMIFGIYMIKVIVTPTPITSPQDETRVLGIEVGKEGREAFERISLVGIVFPICLFGMGIAIFWQGVLRQVAPGFHNRLRSWWTGKPSGNTGQSKDKK